MFPEGDDLANVRSPGRVEAETAELGFAEATSKKVVTEPVDGFVHLATTDRTKISSLVICQVKFELSSEPWFS